MESVVTLNQKSQIVISKTIRKTLGLKPGDELAASIEDDKKSCCGRSPGVRRRVSGA